MYRAIFYHPESQPREFLDVSDRLQSREDCCHEGHSLTFVCITCLYRESGSKGAQ